ncbi:hypothetical protein [Halonatronum saccharophilum]|uniref:hypothetical protein n=1 Tax=Halonatronum saccharophilum TaxID=150060 RepID=UPI0004858EEF|nr:hypothetical protein [Halonatronum saccharophilum]
MDKNFSAKKYFVYGFKNYIVNDNKILSKKYRPSIRELLCDYIEIHYEISSSQEYKKLKNARDELLYSIRFFIKGGVLYNQSLYRIELEMLVKQIEEKEKNGLSYTSIYNTCKALVKKLDKDNIYNHLIEQIKKTESFAEVDKVIEVIINELLYDGYSLKYVDNWFNENIINNELTYERIDDILDKFKDFKREKEVYVYYLGILNIEEFDNQILMNHNLKLIRQNDEEISLLNEKYQTNILSYLQCKKASDVFELQVKAMDVYKGLEIMKNTVNSYFQMITYIRNEIVYNIMCK